jgi:hypothetical protein
MVSRSSVGKQVSKPGMKGRGSNKSKKLFGYGNPGGSSQKATLASRKKKARRP